MVLTKSAGSGCVVAATLASEPRTSGVTTSTMGGMTMESTSSRLRTISSASRRTTVQTMAARIRPPRLRAAADGP